MHMTRNLKPNSALLTRQSIGKQCTTQKSYTEVQNNRTPEHSVKRVGKSNIHRRMIGNKFVHHHFKKWIWSLLVLILLVLTFVPFMPSNAVRLYILQNGHPFAAVLSGPSELPQSETKYYSGNREQLHYQINVPFSTDSADVDVLVVRKIPKHHFYNKYVATPAYALGP